MLHRRPTAGRMGFTALSLALTLLVCGPAQAQDNLTIAQLPLFLGQGTTPLVMLVMGRDHKFYYEAYNDAADLNNDGVVDVGYKGYLRCDEPSKLRPLEQEACAARNSSDSNYLIDYFGYFNSYKCYSYSNGLFTPTSNTDTKTCSGSWSGDFLNYVTMSRMDALRKVLYGGYRSTDTASDTILERAFIPQDAHTWAKEYKSPEEDGFDIADYAPLSIPAPGTRHLFANVTLRKDNQQKPLMRVLTDSPHRAWEWVSIERPVAGNKCNNASNNKVDCAKTARAGGAISESGAPDDAGEFQQWVDRFARDENLIATNTLNQIEDSDAGPYGADDRTEDYLNVITGKVFMRVGDAQTFAVDGNDAIELLIDGKPVADRYGTHGMVCTDFNPLSTADQENCFGTNMMDDEVDEDDVVINAGEIVVGTSVADDNDMNVGTVSGNFQHTFEVRHVQRSGGAGFRLYWYDYKDARWELFPSNRFLGNVTQEIYKLVDAPVDASVMTDYTVRVRVCALTPADNPDCKYYGEEGSGNYKPTGLLQKYGDDDDMLFGLLTGSFNKNLKGGVLRKNIGTLTDEIDITNGTFKSNITGIIETIDLLRIATFTNNDHTYANCGWITDKPLSEAGDGKCADWGNPIAEMMYEAMRYFGGKESPTPDFATTGGTDEKLGLPAPAWENPYVQEKGDYSVCSKPNLLVVGDVNPSYDTDQLPGSSFSNFTGDLEGLNVSTEADTIWADEVGGPKSVFVGEAGGVSDFAPTAKYATSFATIRGIAPEDPSKQGGWYAASVAYHGLKNDLNEAPGDQTVRTFAVAMASPLPQIEIPIFEVKTLTDEDGEILQDEDGRDKIEFGDIINTVTLVPFAKSVGGSGIDRTEGKYQPTNTIVDFYIEELRDDYGKFRINYEDVEQGADHDMDMIVEYIYRVTDMRRRIIEVELNSTYAAGGIKQHAGYVISGTTRDGVYLEVRDVDTSEAQDVGYFLDTRPLPLPLNVTRTFRADVEEPPEILKNPLWYAAKWGNFNNIEPDPENPEENPKPDKSEEWDSNKDGKPDNYFLVTNALYLSEQLSEAFEEIMAQTASAAGVSTSSTRLDTELLVYLSQFTSGVWTGALRAFKVDPETRSLLNVSEWNAAERMPTADARELYTYDPVAEQGITFYWSNLTEGQKNVLRQGEPLEVGEARLEYLRGDQSQEEWNGGEFRNRLELDGVTPNILGDIVNSTAAYVSDTNFGLNALPSDMKMGGDTYTQWRTTTIAEGGIADREPMIYVGANDGMLHAFSAVAGVEGGVEQWAYIPSLVFPHLHELTDPNYVHRYFVDGTPKTFDVYYAPPGNSPNDKEWRSVVVGTLGGGGAGLFAVDATYPDEFNASNILWEYSGLTDTDFGVSLGQPSVVAMADGEFRVIVGNGYNTTRNKPILYILDVATGDVVETIEAPAPTDQGPNGLSTPVVVDDDGDRVADTVYAGDLLGNLWKFDVSSDKPKDWEVAGNEPLFTAVGPYGEQQPITAKPTIAGHPQGGVMVFFGTGQYFVEGDEVVPVNLMDRDVYSFYAVLDVRDEVVTRDELVQQTILTEDAFDPENPLGERFRTTTEEEVPAEKKGWYIDLISPTDGRQEERVVVEPIVFGSDILFVTVVPNEEACAFGGDSWIMVMDAFTGAMPDIQTMDTNDDGKIDSDDRRVAGARSLVGVTSKPTLVETAGGPTLAISTGSKINQVTGRPTDERLIQAGAIGGRQAWRQIQ